MSLRVTVVDEQTGDTETQRIGDGDYLVIAAQPCRIDGVQAYPTTGTHVVTIKGHGPRALPQPKEGFEHPRLGVAGLREHWDPEATPEPKHPGDQL